MANVKISNLTAATTPVAGTEVLPIVQSGATVKVSIANLTPGLSTITTAKGGTGLTSFTSGGVVYASSTSALTTGSALVFDGTNLGLGVTPSAWGSFKGFDINSSTNPAAISTGGTMAITSNGYYNGANWIYKNTTTASLYQQQSGQHQWYNAASGTAGNAITFTQAMTLDTSGRLGVGQVPSSSIDGTVGVTINSVGYMQLQRSSGALLAINRITDDGNLVDFYQAGVLEGAISVSGTTVTYGGGHLARFGQLPDGSEEPTLLKGTVLTNLDEMCVWINKETGVPADNEQCNKVKISDVDGDANVAGVFVSWSYDEQHDTNDLFVAMTGDMIIRIAQGTTVQRGDLLMSAGDGTAKPQGDDIVRSKTVAKVTSTHVTCTYADGSYCVPCVLMAC